MRALCPSRNPVNKQIKACESLRKRDLVDVGMSRVHSGDQMQWRFKAFVALIENRVTIKFLRHITLFKGVRESPRNSERGKHGGA